MTTVLFERDLPWLRVSIEELYKDHWRVHLETLLLMLSVAPILIEGAVQSLKKLGVVTTEEERDKIQLAVETYGCPQPHQRKAHAFVLMKGDVQKEKTDAAP